MDGLSPAVVAIAAENNISLEGDTYDDAFQFLCKVASALAVQQGKLDLQKSANLEAYRQIGSYVAQPGIERQETIGSDGPLLGPTPDEDKNAVFDSHSIFGGLL